MSRIRLGAFALVATVVGCARGPKKEESKPTVEETAPPVPQLPDVFAEVRLGMTVKKLLKLFPAAEDTDKCAPVLLGANPALPAQVPGADKKAASRCARSIDLAGLTFSEFTRVAKVSHSLGGDSSSKVTTSDILEGLILATAQVRSAVRAGRLSEAALFKAAEGSASTTLAASLPVAATLTDGTLEFGKDKSGRRVLCALMAEDCEDLDPARARTYTEGGYRPFQIDADAHSRVVYGKCRATFLSREGFFRGRLLRRTGGLGGIGLARAMREDRKLDPEATTTFDTFKFKSKLKGDVAKIAVTVANALPEVEQYFSHTIVLRGGGDVDTRWGVAIVWIRDGKVVRMLVNLSNDEAIPDLAKQLSKGYGDEGATVGTVTTWKVSGARVRLDIGAAASLVVDDGKELESVAASGSASALPSSSSSP